MSAILEGLREAKATGDWGRVTEHIPYAVFLGLRLEEQGGALLATMRFAPELIGNPQLPALHGGTIGALLESIAIFQCLHAAPTVVLPKTITFTVDFLRPGRPVDTFARAQVTRQGRRVANVRAEAYQDDPARPIATAHALLLVMADD
jgi:uncharacterized protein (TIGR00369 family)